MVRYVLCALWIGYIFDWFVGRFSIELVLCAKRSAGKILIVMNEFAYSIWIANETKMMSGLKERKKETGIAE